MTKCKQQEDDAHKARADFEAQPRRYKNWARDQVARVNRMIKQKKKKGQSIAK